jgi:CBS domain-containing protein
MQVREIMTRDVITARLDTSVIAIARIFRDNAISGVPVVDEEGTVVGIITELDLIARHARPHFPTYIAFLDSIIYLESTKRYRESVRHILATKAGELMTTPVVTVGPETDVQDLATLMVERRVNPVPVVEDEDRLVGIVSHTDLLELLLRAEAPEQASQEVGEAPAEGVGEA